MRRLLTLAAALVAMAFLPAIPVLAADSSWNVPSGYVDVAGNWTPGAPVANDNVYIANSGTATIATDHTFGVTLGYLNLGNGADTYGNITQTGGSVTLGGSSWLRIGLNSTLASTVESLYDMSGGTLYVPSLVVVGLNGRGKLKLSGGNETTVGASLTCNSRVYVGDTHGTGTVEMSDYSMLSGLYLTLGRNATDNTGTISLSGHANMSMTVPTNSGSDDYIGTATGTGTLNMDGDSTASITANSLFVGDGGNGTLNLSGNAVLTNINNETNTGGTLNRDSYTYIGNGSGAVATLNLSGHATMTSTNNNSDTWRGMFWVGRSYSTGTVNLSGGTGYTEETRGAKLIVNHISDIGSYCNETARGRGYLNVHDYAQFETAGLLMGDSGTGELLIDGHGQVTVTGGKTTQLGFFSTGIFSGQLKDNAYFHATGAMYLGHNSGTATLTLTTPTTPGDAVTMQVDGSIYIGNDGIDTDTTSGTLNVNAGTSVNVNGSVYVGNADNGVGTVNMTGGSITTGNWFCVVRTGGGANGTTGTLTMSGDSLVSAGTRFFVGNGYSGGTGTTTLSGNARIESGRLNAAYGDICIAWGGVGVLTVGDGTAPEGDDPGAVAHAAQNLRLGDGTATANATLNLNVGGTVETPYIDTGIANASTINLDGGLLKVLADDTPTTPFLKNAGAVANFAVKVLNDGARIDTNSHNATIDEALVEDVLSPGGGLTKLGEGILTLTKACTYKGATSVEEGALSVNGSITSDVSVADGAALMGNGLVTGNVTVAANGGGGGGRIAAGNSIGTLTVDGDLTVTGTLDVEFNGETGAIDLLDVSGELDLTGGTLSFSNEVTELLAPGAYVFATYDTLVGNPAVELGLPTNCSVNYAYGGHSIALIAVPEPSMLVLAIAMAMALAGWRIRR